MLHTLLLLAEGAPPQAGPPSWFPLILVAGFVLLYFVFMRPRGDAERKALLSKLKKNDKVITIGGIHGTVVSVAEKEDEMIVRVEDNVKLKMLKSAIARNLTNEEDYKEAQKKGKTATKETAPATTPAKDAVTTTPPKT